MYFDTHAHLDLSPLCEAEEAVVLRARDAGVTRIATVGIDPESGERAKIANVAEWKPPASPQSEHVVSHL